MIGRRIRSIHAKEIQAAPAAIAGRAGRVRIVSGRLDLMAIVGYPPPLAETGRKRVQQERAAERTLNWVGKSIQKGTS